MKFAMVRVVGADGTSCDCDSGVRTAASVSRIPPGGGFVGAGKSVTTQLSWDELLTIGGP